MHSYCDNTLKKIIDKVTQEFQGKIEFDPGLPEWLASLPAGKYTVPELIKLSKTGERNVQKTMKKYCKKIEYVEGSLPHLRKCVYHWD